MKLTGQRGSLLLIFLFTVGVLGVVLAGAYWMVTNTAVEQGFLQDVAEKEMVDAVLDSFVPQMVAMQGEYYIKQSASGAQYSQASTPNIATWLEDQVKTAFAVDFTSLGLQHHLTGATVVINQATQPSIANYLSKANATAVSADNLESPFSRFTSYDRALEVTVSGTLAKTGRPYSWSKSVMLMREIPASEIPFVVYGSVTAPQNFTFDADLWISDNGTKAGFGAMDGWSATYDAYASTYGAAGDLCKYAAAGSGTTEQKNQMYALDADAIVVQFTGGVPTVIHSATGAALPGAAIYAATIDGKTRCVVDMSLLPVTSEYINRKWYFYCPTDADKAAGIVLKDNTTDQASATSSIATNGHVYVWTYESSARAAQVVATNYGAIVVAGNSWTGTTANVSSSPTLLTQGFWSLAEAGGDVRFYDSFRGTTSLAGRNPASYTGGVNPDGNTWTVHAATSATTDDGAGEGELTISGGVASFSIPEETTVKGYGVIEVSSYLKTIPLSGSVEIIFSSTAPYDSNSYVSFKITRSATNDFDYTMTSTSGGSTDTSSGTWSGAAAETAGVLDAPYFVVDYCAASGWMRAGVKTAASGEFAFSTSAKLAHRPSAIPEYIQTLVDPGASSAVFYGWGIYAGAGTTVATPHTGTLTLTHTGSISSNSGLGYAGSGTFALNITSTSAVRNSVRNYCERFLVKYPYCW